MQKNKSLFQMYFIYFVSMALFTVVRMISSAGYLRFLHSDISSILFTIVIQVFIMVVIPFSLYALFHKQKGGYKAAVQAVQLNPIKPKVIVLAVLLGVMAFFISIAVSTVFNGFLSFFGYSLPTSSGGGTAPLFNSTVSFLIDAVLVAVLPAICEELLHRGLLLNEISRIGYKKAILISSLLFAFIHFNINQFSYAFVLGLLMGVITVASKTLWPAIIIHFTNNFLSVYLSAAKANGWFLSDFYDNLSSLFQSNSLLLTLLTATFFIALIMLTVIYLVFELFKETTVSKVNNALKSVLDENQTINQETAHVTEKHKILNEMLLTKSNLNLNIGQSASALDVILPINRHVFKPNKYDNVFLISSIVLGGLVTLFTFIWGVL